MSPFRPFLEWFVRVMLTGRFKPGSVIRFEGTSTGFGGARGKESVTLDLTHPWDAILVNGSHVEVLSGYKRGGKIPAPRGTKVRALPTPGRRKLGRKKFSK